MSRGEKSRAQAAAEIITTGLGHGGERLIKNYVLHAGISLRVNEKRKREKVRKDEEMVN